MERINRKGILKFFIKASISILAFYIVLKKIDVDKTWQILLNADIGWLFLAWIIFNLSKITSAFRLNLFFKCIGLNLQDRYNIRLYYVGMFYNLFLPGGIGGDGYKVYLLNRIFKTPVRPLISASLLDRISGLAALVFLAFAFAMFIDLSFISSWIDIVILVLIIIMYPLYYFILRLFFRKFIGSFHKTNFLSLGVQVAQIISALFILFSLDVNNMLLEYQFLFLLSSIVAVIPFTIGGVGARELVFIFGANYLLIDKNTAVAFSLLFFLLTAVSSFIGAILEFNLKKDKSVI